MHAQTHIPVHFTYVHPGAIDLIKGVLDSSYLSEGELVVKFENQLEREFRFKNCVTVNSGTAALHLSMVLAGIKEGDEVILPAQTFIATGLAILQQRAVPVFADIRYTTGNIDPEAIRDKITPKTKAILPVHWGGYPCDMDEIAQLARENELTVIEDAAHALGAVYRQKPIGTLSDFTCFSFQAIKHLTTGDGGALCTPDGKYEQAVAMRWFGIDRKKSPLSDLGERSYELREAGFKYHMNNYAAALGLANLVNFEERMRRRREVADYYKRHLSGIQGIQLFDYHDDRQSAYWLFGFHVEKRSNFIKALKASNIASSVVHQRIDRNEVFGRKRSDLIEQEKFDETQINIPIHDGIDMEKAAYIVEAIRKGW
jgi:perosamine synthetase